MSRQFFGQPFIVCVQKRDEFALGCCNSGVARRGSAPVPIVTEIANARIAERSYDLCCVVLRSIIYNDTFPIGERLGKDAPNGSATAYSAQHAIRGYYSNRSRGARRLAEDDDPSAITIIDDSPVDARRKASWARLIQKVYAVDPLECSHCGATLRSIALIDDTDVIERILRHSGI